MSGFQLGGGGTDGFSLGTGGSSYGFDTSGLTADAGESMYSLGSPTSTLQGGPAYSFQGDYTEAAKMTQFYPTSPGVEPAPWWANLATFGVTRAIDAAIGTTNPGANQAATYAGQNGQTYQQGTAARPPQQGPDMLMLLGIGALVLFAVDD